MARIINELDLNKIGKVLTIAVYPAGLLGMSVFAFQAGPIHIFPYRMLIPLIWVVFILLAIRKREIIDLASLKVKKFGLFLLIWLVYAILSITWGIDKANAIRHVFFLSLSMSVLLFSVVFLDERNDLYWVVLLWLVILGLSLLVGVIETTLGYHLPLSRFYQLKSTNVLYVPTGLFYNPNDFATFLSFSTPFLLSFALYSKKIIYRVLSIGSFFVLLYVMLLTKSRVNYLALALVILYFMVVAFHSRKYTKEWVLLIIGSLLLILVFSERLISEFSPLLTSIQSLSSNLVNPTKSVGIRINMIRNGLSFLGTTRGFGVGAGNFEAWMRTRSVFGTGYILNAHNWYLEVLVNYGVVIFLGYLFFYLGLIRQVFLVLRTHWHDQIMKVVGVAILGGLVGFSLASISPSTIIGFRPHWLLFAFGLAYVNIGLNKAELSSDP